MYSILSSPLSSKHFFKRSSDILFFIGKNETRVRCNYRCTRTTSDMIVKFELIVEYTISYKSLKKKKKKIDKGKQNIFVLFVRTSRIMRSKFQFFSENSRVISSMDIKVKVSTCKISFYVSKIPRNFERKDL